jgi:hypothetical protein
VIAEAAGTSSINVNLSTQTALTVQVPYTIHISSTATDVSDYSDITSTVGTLTFTPFSTSKTIDLSIINDTLFE